MTTAPQTQARWRLRRPSLPVLVATGLVLVLLGTLGTRYLLNTEADPLEGRTPVTLNPTTLIDGLTATGTVAPRREAALAFATTSGRVAKVLVREGDSVEEGQALAQLDTAQLVAAVAAADAALARAQADQLEVQEGATPAEIAAADAAIGEARATLAQTAGEVTAEDVAAAQATLEQARTALAVLEAGPKTTKVQAAQADLDAARARLAQQQAQLQSTRDAMSSTKTTAAQRLEQASVVLQQAQSEYSVAYWSYQNVQETGRVPDSEKPGTNTGLTDYGNLEQQEEFKQVALAMRDAELQVQQAVQALEQARNDEITAVQTAEQEVASAAAEVEGVEAELDELLAGADADDLAAARAAVSRARADLVQLQRGPRAGALAVRQAQIAGAQADREELLESPPASALARAAAGVAEAQARREQARVDLANATLRAPFAGTVAAVGVAPGEIIGAGVVPVTLIDEGGYEIDLIVDEVDVVRVIVGQRVDVLVDALGAPPLVGTVRLIAPAATDNERVRTYAVTVDIDLAGRPVKKGMTASATIIVAQRDNVLVVPSSAVREGGGQQFVDIALTAEGRETTIQAQQVEIGLRTKQGVEVTQGLAVGQQVLLPAALPAE